jgi:hypothetical protein
MYEITVKGNYLIVTFRTEKETKLRQFPMIKTVYSFNGSDFKISEGEIMTETVVITKKDITIGNVLVDGVVSNSEKLETYLQTNTAKYK